MVTTRNSISVIGMLVVLASGGAALAEDNLATTPGMAVPATSEPASPAASDTAPSTVADETTTTADKPTGPLSPTDKIVRRFMELDLDLSEGVSFEEYMTMVNQRAEDRFKSMDANDDGEVSEEEYRNFWLTRKAQWYRLKR